MNMKFLKPLSAILLGCCGNNIWKAQTEDYTTTVVGTIVDENGTDEQLCGIYVTRSQLEQIRDEIDNYLRKIAEGKPKLGIADSLREPEATAVTSSFNFNITGDSKLSKEEVGKLLLEIAQRVTETREHQGNDAEQKQKLKINPELVWMKQSAEIPTMPYCAKISQWCNSGDGDRGSISLYALGKSEEEARATLDAQFEALVLRCVDAAATKSEGLTATFQDQFSKLKEELSNHSPKVKAFVEAVNRITQSETSKPTPNLDNSEKVDETPASETKKTEPQKTEKSQVFKLNPNRVSSRQDHNVTGYAQWEARTTLYFGNIPLEVVCSEYMTEESARAALNQKVERLIDRMTD